MCVCVSITGGKADCSHAAESRAKCEYEAPSKIVLLSVREEDGDRWREAEHEQESVQERAEGGW